MHGCDIHVVTTAVVLRTVATVLVSKTPLANSHRGGEGGVSIPLREGLVATNMAPLAGLATVAGLGVALARGTTARTSHFDVYKEGEVR